MATPSAADIRAHLAALAAPVAGLGELHHLAERLCQIQRTLAPVTAPRRLVLFAADHGAPAGVGVRTRGPLLGGSRGRAAGPARPARRARVDRRRARR